MRVSGVYAIQGPNGVYVGESHDCWGRATLRTAALLGFECGIVRELPGADRLARIRAEAEVAKIFKTRGLTVLSRFLTYSAPQQYRRFRAYKPRLRKPPSARNLEIAEKVRGGLSHTEVSRLYGISRQRVSQIVEAK